MRFDSKNGNDSHCTDASLYNSYITARYKDTNIQQDKNQEVAAIVQKMGANVFAISVEIDWLVKLFKKGVIGHGKTIDTDLPFEIMGDPAVVQMLCDKIVQGRRHRQGLARRQYEGGGEVGPATDGFRYRRPDVPVVGLQGARRLSGTG